MSIALQQAVRQLERDVLEMSRVLTDTKALITEIDQRLIKIEQARKPGPKPKDNNG